MPFNRRTQLSDISGSNKTTQPENSEDKGKNILSEAPLLPLRSDSRESHYILLLLCTEAWVKTRQGHKPIPSHGIPQELRNYPHHPIIANASVNSVKLAKSSRSKQSIGFSFRHGLLGGSSTHKNALEICKDIGGCMERGQFENVLALARELDDVRLKNVKSPDYLAEALLESLGNEQTYLQNSSISQSARLVIAKIANHYLIATLAMNETCPFDYSKLRLPLKILKTSFDNGLYVELKLSKYLLKLKPKDIELVGKRGEKLLKYVSNLNLSQTILEIYQKNSSQNELIDPPKPSKTTQKSFLGRYLILKAISPIDPEDWSIRKLIDFSKEAKGWKTLYFAIEVALGWCLSDCNTVFKKNAIENLIVPLTSFERLNNKYNWRVREKAYHAIFIVENFYMSNTTQNTAKLTNSIIKANRKTEKDIRVLRTLRNKQLTIARFNIGHMHWNYTPQQPKKERNLVFDSNFEGREKKVKYLLENLKTKKAKISILGNAGMGKTALVSKTIQIMIENGSIEQLYAGGVYYYDFSNQVDSKISFSKVGCNSCASLDSIMRSKSSIIVLDRTDCLSKRQLFKVLSTLEQSTIIMASRRFTDHSDHNIYLSPLNYYQSQNIFENILGYRVDEEFCKKLGGLPLAINQAANYIKKKTSHVNDIKSYKEFRDWFKRAWKTERELVSKQAIDKEFTTGFAIRDSLKVLSERSLLCLAILSSMNFEFASFEFIDPRLLTGLKELLEYGFVMKSGENYRLSHFLLYTFCSLNLETTTISKQFRYFTNLFRSTGKRDLLYRHGMRLQAKACELGYYKISLKLTEAMRNFFLNQGLVQEHKLIIDKALKAAENKQDSVNKCNFYFFKGRYYHDRSQYSTAVHYYNKALSIREYKKLQENILEKLALSYVSMKEIEKATKTLKSLRKLIKKTGNKRALGVYCFVKYQISRILCNFVNSKKSLTKALNIFKEMNDSISQMICLGSLGNLYYQIADLDQSIKCFENCLVEFNNIEAPLYYPKIIMLYLGRVYLAKADYKRANEYISSALKYFEHSIYEEVKCECYFFKALLLHYTKDFDKNRGYIYMAEEISRNKDFRYIRFFIISLICMRDRMDNNNELNQYYEEAFQIAAEFNDPGMRLISKTLLFQFHVFNGELNSAAMIINELKTELKVYSNPVYESVLDLLNSYLQFRTSDFAGIENSLENCARISREINMKQLEALALIQLGHLYVTQGRQTQALKYIQQAYDIFNSLELDCGICSTDFLFGLYYAKNNNDEESEKYLTLALKRAKENNYLETIAGINYVYAGLNNLRGKFNEALKNVNVAIDYFSRFNYTLETAYAYWLSGLICIGASAMNKFSNVYKEVRHYPSLLNSFIASGFRDLFNNFNIQNREFENALTNSVDKQNMMNLFHVVEATEARNSPYLTLDNGFKDLNKCEEILSRIYSPTHPDLVWLKFQNQTLYWGLNTNS